MNREDVKIGEKYKVVGKRDYDFEEGEIITISSPYTDGDNWFKTKEKGIIIHCSNFEPINKFEVGDEVRFSKGKGFNAKIFAIADKEDGFGDKYCITYKSQGHLVHAITKKEHLSSLKKKNELEVGDKFKSNMDNEVKVLAVGKDEGKTYYLAKLGMGVVVFSAYDVKEIIYD